MELDQLKTAIEGSGQLQLEYVERKGSFDGVYAAVLEAHSVLQTPYLVPLKQDFLDANGPEEVAAVAEEYVASARSWGAEPSSYGP